MLEPEWYIINNTAALDSPALVFYPERIKENIQLLKGMIDHVDRLRPHVKTHKTSEITMLLQVAGFTKFKCSTIAEAEMLGMCTVPDALLAYQPVGPKIARFIQLIKQYPKTKFSCLVDHLAAAQAISAAALIQGMQITVYLDLNLGMNRTGLSPDIKALSLYKECHLLKGIKPMGFHAYDGHINDASLENRIHEVSIVWEKLLHLQQQILEMGFPEPQLIAGGTPTFPFYASQKNVVCSPGTFALWDKGYQDKFTEQPFLPAALVITRVISLPDDTKLTVDLGHKAIAAENVLNRRVFFLNAPELKPVSQSEEHLVLEAGTAHNYRIGDILYGLPIHVCPTCALYEKAAIVENQLYAGEWKIISRDRRITV
ncbi:MAG: D-TA family PLP-dependent enzyme [Sphingobacteriaceae bacterium]